MRIYAVRSEPLIEMALAFDFNIRRFTAFAAMPMEVAFAARRDQKFADYGTFETTGKMEHWARPAVESTPELLESLERQSKEFNALPADARRELTIRWGFGQIEHLLKRGNIGMQNSMDAVYSAMILEAWTAFECLAGDLWVAGVDHGPGDIVARLIHATRRLKQPDDNIRPETVYHSGIDPKSKYGSFLRAVNCVTFQTLGDIRLYYEIAFGKKAVRLFDEINHGYIAALSAFRNVITHAAGKADKQFLEKIERFHPEFVEIKERDQIELDGEVVVKLTMVSAALGAALLEHIDDMLCGGPPLPATQDNEPIAS